MLEKGAFIFNFYNIKIVKFITYRIHSVPNSVNFDKFTSLIITSGNSRFMTLEIKSRG